MLMIATWAQNVLIKSENGAIYSKKNIDSPLLFSKPRVDEIKVISHPITLINCSKPAAPQRREEKRT